MKKLAFLLFGIFNAVVAHGASLNWGAQTTTGILDGTGAALALGNYVQVGYFGSLTNNQVSSLAANDTPAAINALAADFHVFDYTQIGNGTGLAGTFAKASTHSYASLSGFVPGSQVYFWVLDSTNTSSLGNALSTVTQQAIGYVPSATLASWQFPASDASPASTIDVYDLANTSGAVMLAGTSVSSDSASLDSILGTGNTAVELAPVPEPSSFLFGALTALASATIRRRRQTVAQPVV
jgi:hypothetical protein